MICIKKDLKEKAPGVDPSNFISLMMAFRQVVFNDVDPQSLNDNALPEDMLPRIEGLF